MSAFIQSERLAQASFFARNLPAEAVGTGGSAYRLKPEHWSLNIHPAVRDLAQAYFEGKGISWHMHANHGLSSQICCVNFLMPLATRPRQLASVIGGALGVRGDALTMLPVECAPDGMPMFVGFEWIGRRDYLKEVKAGQKRTRGANVTSADAVVRFEHAGRREALLIEWKYTESYGAKPDDDRKDKRLASYGDLAFAPAGPLKADTGVALEEFFWEPFYQLLRQQMVAAQMQEAREDGAERVRVLHISPNGNADLHRVTAPALRHLSQDAFEAFRSLLVRPDDFISASTEAVFSAALAAAEAEDRPWADYLLERYSFLRRD
jgi:hypothetical protein